LISGRPVTEAACGRYTLVAQREGTLRERDDGALEIEAESAYLVRDYDGLELSRVIVRQKGATEGLLRMGNFVGESRLGGRRLVITSTRATGPQVDRMLADLTDAMSSLPTGFAAPVGLAYDRSALTGHDVLSQAYAFVRDAMWAAGPHDLPAAVSRILARPHERLVREEHDIPVGRVDRLDAPALLAIASRPDRLVPVPPGGRSRETALAARLHGRLPEVVHSSRAQPSADTVENRFVLSAIDAARLVVRSFDRRVRRSGHPSAPVHAIEAAGLAAQLELWLRHPALAGLEPVSLLPLHSTVLRGRPGYRELTRFYLDLIARSRLLDGDTAGRLIDARDVAAIYECWCYTQVALAVARALDMPAAAVPIREGDFAYDLIRGGHALVGDVRVSFNRTFRGAEGGGRNRSYSVELRPDIVVEHPDGTLDLFDAKFKRDVILSASADDEDADQETLTTYRRGDLYKMHTYRDAIGARSVWVLYPGTGELESHAAPDAGGVGAIPLLPGASHGALDKVVADLFTAPSPQGAPPTPARSPAAPPAVGW
jgi:predicted component of viral defense system (DUF524 family)